MRALETEGIHILALKPKHLYVTRDFRLRAGFPKRARVGSPPHPDRVFFFGAFALRGLARRFLEGLLDLTVRALGAECFLPVGQTSERTIDLSPLFKSPTPVLRVSDGFLNQNCCFLHFLLGQKRVLAKSSSTEHLLSKSKLIHREVTAYRALIKRLLDKHPDFENFLCFCTRLDAEERLTLSQAVNHKFLSEFSSEEFLKANARLLESLFNIFVDNERQNVPQFYARTIFKSLAEFYRSGERWFDLKDPFTSPRNYTHTTHDSIQARIDFLGYELGLKPDEVLQALEATIKS